MQKASNSCPDNKVSWAAPSNIALVKYWGKKGFQIPANASLSMTLSKAYTETSLTWAPKNNCDLEFEFFFEGKENPKFYQKIKSFLLNISNDLSFLKNFNLKIESSNNFPHSTGIASSASSMAALALCLCEMEQKLLGTTEDFFKRASYIGRIGSGSASRSLFGGFVRWGEVDGSGSDLHAEKLISFHPVFSEMMDTILIISSDEKKLSSTMGHKLMDESLGKKERITQANNNFLKMLQILKIGDMENFGKVLEEEALNLHAQIITSTKGEVILLKPNSLEIIERVRKFRLEKKLNLYFTLDAGPNVHLIYPKNQQEMIISFIESDLLPLCKGYIPDEIGKGPWKTL